MHKFIFILSDHNRAIDMKKNGTHNVKENVILFNRWLVNLCWTSKIMLQFFCCFFVIIIVVVEYRYGIWLYNFYKEFTQYKHCTENKNLISFNVSLTVICLRKKSMGIDFCVVENYDKWHTSLKLFFVWWRMVSTKSLNKKYFRHRYRQINSEN